jgi:hypothetical protein
MCVQKMNAIDVQYLNAKFPSCQVRFSAFQIIKPNYNCVLVMLMHLLDNEQTFSADLLGSISFLLLPEHIYEV